MTFLDKRGVFELADEQNLATSAITEMLIAIIDMYLHGKQ